MSQATEKHLIRRTCWQAQRHVVFALFLRELGTRFGLYRLGYFWAVAEPVALILVLSGFRMAMGRTDIGGIPYPLFFASGIIPFQFFYSTVSQCLQAVEANKALMNYRIVQPMDAVLARWTLEMLVYLFTAILILSGMNYLGYTFSIRSYLELSIVLILLSLFTLGFSLIISVIGPLFHESKKVIPIMMRPLFFISGVFFPADIFPPSIRSILLWNPLMQFIELIRFYLFRNAHTCYGTLSYVALSTLICLFFGLSYYRMHQQRLSTSGEIR